MRRLLPLLAVIGLITPLGASAEAPVEDIHDIELVDHVPYGDPEASGTTPFFASGTDLAFDGDFVYAAEQADSGNTEGGIHIIDVSDPDAPEVVGFVDCPGSQNDVLVVEPGIVALGYHSLTGQGGEHCPFGEAERNGVTLFDVSAFADPEVEDPEPALLGSAHIPGRLSQGTHTFTLHPSGDYIYASPGGLPVNGQETAPLTVLDISDRENPVTVAEVVSNGIGCHDFAFFDRSDDSLPSAFGDELGVCVGLTETSIWDVSDPADPLVISRIHNPLIFFDHTGIVTDDGKYLVIGDEAFGAHDCAGGPTGAMFAYDVSTPEAPVPVSYFGIDRAHGDATYSTDRVDWCTAHLYNFIPDTYIMVAAWYSGGVNVIDWTDMANPREVAHYRTDGDYAASEVTNYWSAYWHEGRIYANDRVRGFDALEWTGLADHLDVDPADATPEELTRAVQAMPSTPSSGWNAGALYDTPTPEQAAWLLQQGAPSLDDLGPYSCRLIY